MPLDSTTSSANNGGNNCRTCTTSTAMRIRKQSLLLGVIVVLGLPSAPQAYVMKQQKQQKHNSVMQTLHHCHHNNPMYRQSASSSAVSFHTMPKRGNSQYLLLHSTASSNQEEMPPFHNPIMESSSRSDTATAAAEAEAKNKRNITTGLAMAAFFVASQFSIGLPKGISAAAGDNKGLLCSAVSATFLRQNNRHSSDGSISSKLSRWINVPNLLLVLVSLQGLQQLGRLTQGLTTCGGFFSAWYMGVLNQHPLLTKSVTAAAIGVAGDTAAQFLEQRLAVRSSKKQQRDSTATTEVVVATPTYDKRRGLAIFGDSLLISGPLLHIFYDLLESAIPVVGPYASVKAMGHVLIDNFVLDAIFVAVMFVFTGFAEGYSIKQIIPQLKKDYVSTMKAGWATSIALMPLMFVCFRFLPLSFRVLGMNIIDIFWEGMISYMVHRRRRVSHESGAAAEESAVIAVNGAVPVLATDPANNL